MSQYNRTNAIPNKAIDLKVVFSKFGNPFDPFSVGPALITKKDPRSPSYDESIDLLETIPANRISKVSPGQYLYTTANTTITEVGTFYDSVKFKFEENGEEFLVVNTFQVTATGVPKLGYVTVQQLRDEGIDATKYPDGLVNSRIAFASRMIERFTGRFFEPRHLTIDVDGHGGYELQLDMPIIDINEVVLLDREFPVTKVFWFELDDLVIYNRHLTQGLTMPDDRDDPRIGNVYFPKGRMNLRITGTFGYTDLNGNTPPEIERACMLMAIRDLEKLGSAKRKSSLLTGLGPIKKETTDDHSYELAIAELSRGTVPYYTGDPEIDQLLADFFRPPQLGRNLGANVATSVDGGIEFDRFRTGFDFLLGRSL